MTTIRQLVIDAYRESGLIPVGGVPDSDEFDEGVRRIASIVKGLYGTELGEPLATMSYGINGLGNPFATAEDASSLISSSYVPYNVRLVFNLSAATTVYLHPNPHDGARFGLIDNANTFDTYPLTVNANGRQIENAASLALATEGLNREWFYRADLGEWTRVTDLTADDISPFPSEFDDLLTTLLAIRINPRYGQTTKSETGSVMSRMRTMFRARYKQTIEVQSEEGIIRLPSRSNRRYDTLSLSSFSRGTP